MDQSEFLEIFVLAERLHRQFLDSIQLELDVLNIRDINNVRALMLLNIGDAEMTVSELLWRGCYLGSNVSYNLKKLTEAGYVVQERSSHDRRVIMVRNSPKGAELCAILEDMNARHIAALAKANFRAEDLEACRHALRGLQRSWSRSGDGEPQPQAADNGAPRNALNDGAFVGPPISHAASSRRGPPGLGAIQARAQAAGPRMLAAAD